MTCPREVRLQGYLLGRSWDSGPCAGQERELQMWRPRRTERCGPACRVSVLARAGALGVSPALASSGQRGEVAFTSPSSWGFGHEHAASVASSPGGLGRPAVCFPRAGIGSE